VTGTVERIDAGPSELRSELLEDAGERKNLNTYGLLKLEKLRLELIAHFDQPSHFAIMPYAAYDVKGIQAILAEIGQMARQKNGGGNGVFNESPGKGGKWGFLA
jgi:hypothetical protein